MILREKDAYTGGDGRGFYGHKQEQDVAFHLRRQFGEHKQIHVINDLRIEHRGERAQIDHLVIHPYGFIIIESKSIVGEVQVNGAGEWSRSYQGNWMGIPSPIRQAELQEQLLHRLLGANVKKMLGKSLGIQSTVGGRDWQVLCAVSSTAILHRDKMPKSVASKVVKTEFLSQKVREVVGNVVTEYLKAKPKFSKRELDNIGRFLLEHTLQLGSDPAVHESAHHHREPAAPVNEPQGQHYSVEPASAPVMPSSEQPGISDHNRVTCKQCGEAHHLTGMYGQYGYYVKCGNCSTNTSMKHPCLACGWKSVRVSKDGTSYMSTCQKCGHQSLVYQQEEGRV